MAASSTSLPNPHHARSTSMPSRSHPLMLKVEEELMHVRDWQNTSSKSSSSSSSIVEILCNGFIGLNQLYGSIEDLLHLPLTQQAIFGGDEKHVNVMLDDCLRLLDVCCTIRDALLCFKEQVHNLQSSLRVRRGGELGMGARLETYLHGRRKLKKEMAKCLRVLKRMESKTISIPTETTSLDHNRDRVVSVDVLRELRSITVTILGTLASFVFGDARLNSRSEKWSLISRLLGTSRVACEREEEICEVERVDVALYTLKTQYLSKMEKDVHHVQTAQRLLEALEISITSLEAVLECTFRHLIKIRVSLLNLFTH